MADIFLLFGSCLAVVYQLFLALGAEIENHSLALEVRHIIRLAILGEVVSETREEEFALLLEDDRTSAEEDIGFDFVALLEELDSVLELEVVIMIVGLWTETDLLDFLLLSVRFCLFLFFLLRVEEFLVIDYSADRRRSGRSDLNEVEVEIICYFHSLLKRVDALLYVFADKAHLCHTANFVVNAMRIFFNNTTTAWSGSNSCYSFSV